jgi:peptidoglycan/LPS O-acetylase OafA/YrhL
MANKSYAFPNDLAAADAVAPTACPPADRSLATPRAVLAPGGRIPVLDGLRGIAILLVMIFHFWHIGFTTGPALWERIYTNAANVGWAGVDLFFVLSGFLITGILYDSRDDPHYYRVFYARRTVRIFPLYYGFLVFCYGILPFTLGILHRPQFAPIYDTTTTKLFAWTYSLNWFIGLKGFHAASASIQHFWSLAIEEQFYLAWPFLVLTLTRRRLMGLCSGLVGLGFVLRVVLLRLQLPDAAYTWTFARTDSLAIGALLALAARDPEDWKSVVKWASRLILPALCGIVALTALLDLRPQFMSGQFVLSSFKYSLLAIFFGGCLAAAVCSRKGSLVNRSLTSPFLKFFGKYSYGLYVFHQPLMILFVKIGIHTDRLTGILGNKFLAVVAVNGLAFAFSIAIALASWNLYEKHWLKLKDLSFLQREAEA